MANDLPLFFTGDQHADAGPGNSRRLVNTHRLDCWRVVSVRPGATGASWRDVAVGHTWPFQSEAWQRVVSTPGGIRAEAITWTGPIQQVCIDGLHPFRQLFERKITWQVFVYYLVGGVWSLLIWSVLGGAMTRMAVVRLGRNDREGMFEAWVSPSNDSPLTLVRRCFR